ncbi:MAG: pantoate--beta-alanine ligase [Acidimicrobiales bacterium]|nr:pantoate--beta-alanine ligase [Acidimicrobiales bacterium]
MLLVTTAAELRAHLDAVRRDRGRVGLVPTMGFLHDGHVSLMAASVADNDCTVVTIFVNPLQFAPTEDLAAYPRDLDRDRERCEEAGVDLVFAPSVEEMYPAPVQTTVTVDGITATMEGASRPTHFAGVATVVAKLFALAGPCRAYFGEKDFQQLAVVATMARDLSFPVEVVGCPIVREADGLALSSRNAYLTEEERAAAPVLHEALEAGAAAVRDGERDPEEVRALVAATIRAEPRAELDYVAVVDAGTLEPVDPLRGEVRLLAAARFGRARLLDNVGVSLPAGG